jgi:hypothetical protein
MSLLSGSFARRVQLPWGQTREVVCEPDLQVKVDDGSGCLQAAVRRRLAGSGGSAG